MRKKILDFSIEHLQVMDESGKVDSKLMPKVTPAQVKKMYETMVLTRVFDDKAIKLQRQGRLGTFASIHGQEACQIGSAMLLKKDDVVFPAFREHGVYMVRNYPIDQLFLSWGGDERGMALSGKYKIFPISIPVGSHPLHAAGAGMAFKLKKEKRASVAYFGDGATSEGDCLEAFNFAGTFSANTVFICQNNQFAISVPVKEQTAAESIAQKAIAFGIKGIQVDGNDVFGVYVAMQEALDRARSGKGATLIECYTYRIGDHTTSDDAKKYRKEKEVKEWVKKDPIVRLEKYMVSKKIGNKKYFDSVLKMSQKKIDEAVAKYEKIPDAKPEEIFNYMFAEKTPELVSQQKRFLEEVK